MTDAILTINETHGVYDFVLNANGDVDTSESYDTAILYSLYGERRASPDEVVDPLKRRGWIGNDKNFENGSKLWLLEQARLTKSNLNRLEDESKKALEWFVDDGLAVSIDSPQATVRNGDVNLEVVIRRSRDIVDRKNYTIWENTGAS